MGTATSESDGRVRELHTTLLVLNVYDLTPINNYLYWFGFGIYHSGIEVHGKEYGYGAHDFPASGVFEVEPRKCPGFTFRCSVTLGQINMHPSEFRTFLENLASEYHGDIYHLISKNCNHFTDDVSYRLTGKGIPGWVNRLAKLVITVMKPVENHKCELLIKISGALCSCLLPESLQATTVKQLPEYHEYSDDDEADSLSSATPRDLAEIDDEQEKLLTHRVGTEDVHFIKESHSPT